MNRLTHLFFVCLLASPLSGADWFPIMIDAPEYPLLGTQAQITGTVELKIVIDDAGGVARADVVSGNAVLAQAAKDNILKWKFASPCLPLNGERTFNLRYIFKLEGEAYQRPRTWFRYEHPYRVLVTSEPMHWMPTPGRSGRENGAEHEPAPRPPGDHNSGPGRPSARPHAEDRHLRLPPLSHRMREEYSKVAAEFAQVFDKAIETGCCQ